MLLYEKKVHVLRYYVFQLLLFLWLNPQEVGLIIAADAAQLFFLLQSESFSALKCNEAVILRVKKHSNVMRVL